MKIIGLVGGVACGKSRIAGQIQSWGAGIIQGDPATHKVLQYPEVIDQMFARWRDKVFASTRPPSSIEAHHRRAIANYVFQHPKELAFLEAITGPLIVKRLRNSMARYNRDYIPALVLDVPLLFELGLDRDCHAIWYIDAPEGQRLLNFTARYNTDNKAFFTEKDLEDDFKAREKRLGLENRKSRATAIINNCFSNFYATVATAKELYEELLKQ